MTFYVQYDDNGTIAGMVMADETPACENQLVFEKWVNIDNKEVDPDTKQLIDLQTGDIFNRDTWLFEPDVNQEEVGFWERIKNLLGL